MAAQILNHWATREVLVIDFSCSLYTIPSSWRLEYSFAFLHIHQNLLLCASWTSLVCIQQNTKGKEESMSLHLKVQFLKASMRQETLERVKSPRETYRQEGKKLKGWTEDMKPAKETNEQSGKISTGPLV